MKTFTIKDIRSWKPCYDPNKYLPEDFKGNALDILNHKEIPIADKIWVVCRKEGLSHKILHEFGCRCAELVLDNFEKEFPNDDRLRLAIEYKRKWLRGEITEDELYVIVFAAKKSIESAWNSANFGVRFVAESACQCINKYDHNIRLAARFAVESAVESVRFTGYGGGFNARNDMEKQQLQILLTLIGEK